MDVHRYIILHVTEYPNIVVMHRTSGGPRYCVNAPPPTSFQKLSGSTLLLEGDRALFAKDLLRHLFEFIPPDDLFTSVQVDLPLNFRICSISNLFSKSS